MLSLLAGHTVKSSTCKLNTQYTTTQYTTFINYKIFDITSTQYALCKCNCAKINHVKLYKNLSQTDS